jgi:RNA polymerase-binding transcription factor DksA
MGELEKEMKKKIDKELMQVKREILTIREEELSEQQGGGDNTPLTEDADVAQLLEGIEIRSERQSWLSKRARALEEALHRIRRGTYGICTSCEKPIARKRLDAIPEAALCTECQTRMETEDRTTRKPSAPGPSEWSEAKEVIETSQEDFTR